MPRLTPELLADILALCEAGASEIAAALGRALDTSLRVHIHRAGSLDFASLPDGFDGPGLVVVLKVGTEGVLFLLPESCGFLPSWYANPDATGQSKLTTLAQELGMLVIPESLPVEDFRAGRVSNLREAMVRAGLVDGAPSIAVAVSGAKTAQAVALLTWPAAQPDQSLVEAKPSGAKGVPSGSAPSRPPLSGEVVSPVSPSGRKPSLRDLPSYSKSLLRVKIPVAVTLARKKHPLGKILELGPGSIIHFDKSCEELLELEAAGYPIALGEAVKVGEKFGLRILRIRLPDERILPVKRRTLAGQ